MDEWTSGGGETCRRAMVYVGWRNRLTLVIFSLPLPFLLPGRAFPIKEIKKEEGGKGGRKNRTL